MLRINGRLYFRRGELETYKKVLIAEAMAAPARMVGARAAAAKQAAE